MVDGICKRMKLYLSLFVCCCFFSLQVVKAQIPVILRVTAAEQIDTTGCNFVNELTRITYDAVISGKAKLWDTPEKEIHIMPSTLKEIEKSSSTSFIEQDVVFIYELWQNSNKALKSTTNGFLFSNTDKLGNSVAYGYVDAKDLQEIFIRSRIQTNANGNYNSNLTSYVSSKQYNYKFLQFSGKVIDNASESQLIKDQYIGNTKFNTTEFSVDEIPQKVVKWSIERKKAGNDSSAANMLLNAIEMYLHNNDAIFYNLDIEKQFSHLPKTSRRVSGVKVKELWKKIDGQILYDPISLTVFINDVPLEEVLYKDMVSMEISIGNESWIDYLKAKKFLYVINKINSQDISREEAFKYQKALLTFDWNRITDFVKYY
jgi:hypothetical protein